MGADVNWFHKVLESEELLAGQERLWYVELVRYNSSFNCDVSSSDHWSLWFNGGKISKN